MRRFRLMFYRPTPPPPPRAPLVAPRTQDTVQVDAVVRPDQFAAFVDCLGDEGVPTVRDGRAIVTLRVRPRVTLVVQTPVGEFLGDDRSSDRDLADEVRRAIARRNDG